MRQVLRDTSALLTVTFYADETPTDADGAVTVTVTDANGDTVDSATATNESGTGVYGYVLEPRSDLAELTVAWTGTFGAQEQTIRDRVDVVGAFYVALGEIRTGRNLSNTSKFTSAELAAARQWFETLAESYCGRAFVPRYARETFRGMAGRSYLTLRHPDVRTVLSVRVYSDAVTFQAFTVDELADLVVDGRHVARASLGTWWAASRLVVEYEHGMDGPPADVRDAALLAIRNRLLEDQAGRPVLSIANELGGTTRFSVASSVRPTGIPDVDSVLDRYRLIPVG